MTAKKIDAPENTRKRKRIVPTRAAGTPAFDVVEDLFSKGFANRDEVYPTVPYPTVVEPTIDTPTLPESGAVKADVSPKKNFTKVSNSILKQAIPEGLFRGQSKHTYDVLYLHTRGAINPVRQIQLTKLALVKLTGLETKTIQRHLSFLKSTGLITVDPKIGDHKGAIYEVNIPEEVTLPYPTLVHPAVVEASVPESGIDSTPYPSTNSTTVGYGLMPENIKQNEVPKTSLKTNTNDDEAFALFIENFQAAAKEITGKKLLKHDAEKLKELSELLILELKMAARRTENISSVPAFLTEVLRRKLRDLPSTITKQTKVKKDAVGKGEVSEYEIKALDEKGREAALEQLREFVGDEFLQDFKKWYTEEDWSWLIKELESK
jgi:hypothetical protein